MQTFCGLTTDGMLEYLAAIYKLIEGEDSATATSKVTTTALSEKMHVSPAAASSMLKRLEETGFVERSNVDGITLTQQGVLAALQLIRRHRLLEVFLIQVMGFTWDQVDSEAHRLEHAVSSAFEERMDALCGFPSHCPHGDPIPTKDGVLPVETLLPLTSLKPGQAGVLRRVGIRDARVLRYLTRLSLEPGQSLRMVDVAPFRGPVTMELLGETPAAYVNGVNGDGALKNGMVNGTHNGGAPATTQILGHELAEQLFVLPSTFS